MLKIFLTDLAGYNSGHLRGEFLTLPMEEKELEVSIKKILICGDEYFITDYEFKEDVELFKVEEFDNPFKLNKKIALIEESLEPYQYRSVKVLLENGLATSLEDAIGKVDELIVYPDSTMTDIAEQYIEEYTDLNGYHPLIVSHIDYEGIGRDLEIEGSFYQDGSDYFEFIG
jgi:hypothetical protein